VIAYGSADATTTLSFLASFKSGIVVPAYSCCP